MNPYESPQLDSLEELQKPLTATPEREEVGTLHLTLFAAGAAIATALYAYSCFRLEWWPDWYYGSYMVPYLAVTGAGLGGVMLFVYRRCTGANTFPRHFGHWFLICYGISWILWNPFETIYYSNRQVPWDLVDAYDSEQGVPLFITAERLICFLVNMLLLAWAIGRCRHERCWQLYGVFRIANEVLACLYTLNFLESNPWVITILSCVIMLAVVAWLGLSLYVDLRRSERRDFLHWAGIGVEIMYVGHLLKFTVSLVRWALEYPLY